MNGVKFNGRMGNQIFQYAFLRYLQTNNPKRFIFFINPHHACLTKYFDLDKFQNVTLGSKLYSLFTRSLPKLIDFKELYITNLRVPKEIQIEKNTIYKGFFQTDWYLNQIAGDFHLKIKPEFIKKFASEFGAIFNNYPTITVHIRRTDYLNYGKRDISLPMEYFKSRLDAIGDLSKYKVFFVSDDIAYVKSYFGNASNFIYSNNNEITDFQIIKNANIAIISNSSFAWWAAYLSEKENTVYAPKNWLGFRIGKEHPKKIMTSKFIWCEVNG